MKKSKSLKTFLLNILCPCLLMSFVVGILVGTITFFFKVGAFYLMKYSDVCYEFVAEHLAYLPVLIIALALFGIASYFITKYYKCARGGGIPTACGILRGVLVFRWLHNLIATIGSAFLTYFAGLPLGEEGQSVQIGTCVGKGVSLIVGKKKKAWERYVMTGGASAGFAIATGAPLSGVLFAVEEAHKRVSPMIILSSMATVIFGFLTSSLLKLWTGLETHEVLLKDAGLSSLSINWIWVPLVIGILVGLFAAGINTFFKQMDQLFMTRLKRIPRLVKVILAFVLCGLIGVFLPLFRGGGIGLINALIQRQVVLWMIALLFLLKVLLSLFSNSSGVTGGLFIPTLCQGALLGAFFGDLAVLMGLPAEIYLPIVLFGISSYLSAIQRIPLTALVFSFEVLGGLTNPFFSIIVVFVSFLIVEMLDTPSMNDIALENRLREDNAGRVRIAEQAVLTIQDKAFAIGKTVRDIFWPASCQILSIEYGNTKAHAKDGDKHIHKGNILKVRYHRFDDDRDETYEILKSICGDQEIQISPVQNE